MAQPKTSDKIKQLSREWEAMIGSFVPVPLQPHMAASLHGMRQVLAEVEALEQPPEPEPAAEDRA